MYKNDFHRPKIHFLFLTCPLRFCYCGRLPDKLYPDSYFKIVTRQPVGIVININVIIIILGKMQYIFVFQMKRPKSLNWSLNTIMFLCKHISQFYSLQCHQVKKKYKTDVATLNLCARRDACHLWLQGFNASHWQHCLPKFEETV